MLRSLYTYEFYIHPSLIYSHHLKIIYIVFKKKNILETYNIWLIVFLERQDKPRPIILAEKTPVQPKLYLSFILYLMHCQDTQILQRTVSGVNYTHSLNDFDYQLNKSLHIFVVEEWKSLHMHYFHIILPCQKAKGLQ